ncbi:MAG: hypothetical protein ABW173_11290 [Sphingomonas sp.]
MTEQTGGDIESGIPGDRPTLTTEEIARRKARQLATDDGDAAHMGGSGAQGGQADFGLPKNYS